MSLLIKIIIFFLGMGLAVQVAAAFYRILDFWETIDTAYPKVMKGILGWGGLSALIALILGTQWRMAFLWGMFSYIPLYLLNYTVIQAIIRHKSRPDKSK